MTASPLSGLTVLDLSRVLSGPYCTMLAADMGARVIKVEHPEKGDDTRAWGPPFLGSESAYFLSINRNKESVALDFKLTGGRAVLDALIAKADVLVENFRPGTLERLGLGFTELSRLHPRLIYVSISGLGHTGPRRSEAGYDAVTQAEGGLMSITGTREGPPVRLGVAVADIVTGMFAFQGMLLALIARGTNGRGQHVDVSMLDSVVALLTYQAGRHFATGEVPGRTGNQHMTIAPYDTFDTADGVLVLAVGNDAQWLKLSNVIRRRELGSDPRFASNAKRVENYGTLKSILLDEFARWPLDKLVDALKTQGIPAGGVRSIDEVLRDPQIIARAMVETVQHPALGPLRVLGIPVKLSETPGHVTSPPPTLGQHTRAVLEQDVRLTATEIEKLAKAGAVQISQS